MESVAMEAHAVCSRLSRFAQMGERRGSVHSVFDHAVNLEFDERLISVVQRPRGLVPYGLSVETPRAFPETGMAQGMEALLRPGQIVLGNGLCFGFHNAAPVDLSIDAIASDHMTDCLSSGLRQVWNLLRAEGGTDGMSVLVTDAGTNVFADLIRPRLPALFAAVAAGDADAAVNAVMRIAGCGVGLTPGSDDLLTGYFVTVRLLSRYGRMRDARALLPLLAAAAAKKTNRISGAFLNNSGDGLASEDFLRLLWHVCITADAAKAASAAKRVAQFGSTSGKDMLTGLVLAIQHHDGGKNSGKAGNPEKRIL